MPDLPVEPISDTEDTTPTAADGGHREQVIALLMKHRLEIYAFLRAAVGNHHDAEDLLQEVSLAVSRDYQQFRPGTLFPAWLRQIARNRILDYRRKSGRRAALLRPEVLASLDAAAQAVETERPTSARRDALHECLHDLDGVARKVMALRYEANLAVARIAATVQKTPVATYAIIKRTRQILRDCVDRRLAAQSRGTGT
ncbi:MAG: sigma-70 family RNA polymerase sigma factor [Planctomycetota bacterium]